MSDRLSAIEMAIFNTAGLTGTLSALNGSASYTIYTGDGFQEAIKVLKVYNASNVGVTLSFDGVTPNDFIPAGSHMILDIQTNHEDHSAYGSGTLNGAKGQIIYGSGSSGVGNFYIVGYK